MEDKMTREDVAAAVGMTPGGFSVALADRSIPHISPSFKAGGRNYYDRYVVDDWLKRVEKWRADAPARAAAKRAETQRINQQAMDEAAARQRESAKLGQIYQEGFDRLAAEAEAFENGKDYRL